MNECATVVSEPGLIVKSPFRVEADVHCEL